MNFREIWRRLAIQRGKRSFSEREERRAKNRSEHEVLVRGARHRQLLQSGESINSFIPDSAHTPASIIRKYLPPTTLYLIETDKSPFYIDLENEKAPKKRKEITKEFHVPSHFSLIDNPDESFDFIRKLIWELVFGKGESISLDYHRCEKLDIGAQVFLDIVLKDVFAMYDVLRNHPNENSKLGGIVKTIRIADLATTPEFVRKILFSVGSFAIHKNKHVLYADIIPYQLCIHDRNGAYNRVKAIERKDIDTTTLADYVIDSLRKMNKQLTPKKREDLCVIIGEALINAEEHATTNFRFSIGYFQDEIVAGTHSGLFRLIIMNFGKTIYEKFADPECPNKPIVEKMKSLSRKYTTKRWFTPLEFEEETLWTLYALQDGVTSVADKKRGHGTMQFIDSFFNLNGEANFTDGQSRMVILSGSTNITFDNKYRIRTRTVKGETIKVMTFNDKGKIEEKPDKDNVKYTSKYFPGTVISARIVFDEEDFDNENGEKHN